MHKRSGPYLEGIFDFWKKGQKPSEERRIPQSPIPAGIDFYAVLGVPPNVSDDALRAAFRALALRMHPDLFPNDADAQQRFAMVTQAYEVLRDPERRAKYDQIRNVGQRPGTPPPTPQRGMTIPEAPRPTMFSVFRPPDAPATPPADPRVRPPAPPAKAPPRELTAWEKMFGAAEGARPYSAPTERMFEQFAPEAPQPSYQFPVAPTPKTPPRPFMPVPPPGGAMPYGMRIPPPDIFPTVQEMAEFIQSYWPLETIWEVVREGRNGAAFAKSRMLDVDRLAGNDPREGVEYELAAHLGLDDALINDYQKRGLLTSALWNEIMYPMFDLATKALEIIKPREFPGYFFIAPTEGLVGVDLFYTEQAGRSPAV